MNFLRWLIRPHFSPLSLAGFGFIMLVVGRFRLWWQVPIYLLIVFAADYFVARD